MQNHDKPLTVEFTPSISTSQPHTTKYHSLLPIDLQNLPDRYGHLHNFVIAREHRRVEKALTRAYDLNQPATLTTFEWIDKMLANDMKCHYCDVWNANTLEHVVPLRLGGGTTADNCIPCCKRCNQFADTFMNHIDRAIDNGLIATVHRVINRYIEETVDTTSVIDNLFRGGTCRNS